MNKLNEEKIKFLEKVFFNTYDTVFITEESEGNARTLQNKNKYVYYDANNFEEGGDLLKPNLSCHIINTLLQNSMYLYGHHSDTEGFENFKKEVIENLDIVEELYYFFDDYNNFVQGFYKAIE